MTDQESLGDPPARVHIYTIEVNAASSKSAVFGVLCLFYP